MKPITKTIIILTLIGALLPTSMVHAEAKPKEQSSEASEGPRAPTAKRTEAREKIAVPSENKCTTLNVAKGMRIIKKKGVSNMLRITDGKAAAEGTSWNGKASSIFRNTDSFVVFDLGRTQSVSAMTLQGDNNDSYAVETSNDGDKFSLYWTVPETSRTGMRTRKTSGTKVKARYVRVSPVSGDSAFSVGDVQVFCAKPTPFPPIVPRIGKAATTSKKKGMSRDHKIAIYKICIGVVGFLAFIYWLAARRRDFDDPVAAVTAASLTAILAILAAVFGYLEMKSFSRTFMQLAIGLSTLSLAWFMWFIAKARGREKVKARLTAGVFFVMIWTSAFTFIEFGTFHGGRAIHYWDSFHYYVGAKYFKENGYDLIYQCAAISDVDDGRRNEFKDRKIRNLRDGNALTKVFDENDKGEEIIRHITPEAEAECKAKFTPERWAEFQQDLRLFRAHLGTSRWGKMFMDHGFNATPVWLLAGHPLANTGGDHLLASQELVNSPANLRGKTSKARKEIRAKYLQQKKGIETRVGTLALIDATLYVLIFSLIFWAFGLPVCAVAMLIWCSGYPWHYDWTGGSFGRVPWLFMCTAGVCFLKKGYAFLGGAAITWSMLLRLFPGAFIAGVTAKIAYGGVQYLRGKAEAFITPSHWKLIGGCTVALVGLVLASFLVVGGPSAYTEFYDNTVKHKGTKLTNHMGLPTMLSYRPSHVGQKTKKSNLDDPWKVWKAHRTNNLNNLKWLHYGLLAGTFLMLMYIGRRRSDWEVTALSALMVVSAVELTCYYFTFVILLAPFAFRKGWYAAVIGLMPVLSQIIFLLPTWNDVRYVNLSTLVYVCLLLIVLGEFWSVWQEDRLSTEDTEKLSEAVSAKPTVISG